MSQKYFNESHLKYLNGRLGYGRGEGFKEIPENIKNIRDELSRYVKNNDIESIKNYINEHNKNLVVNTVIAESQIKMNDKILSEIIEAYAGSIDKGLLDLQGNPLHQELIMKHAPFLAPEGLKEYHYSYKAALDTNDISRKTNSILNFIKQGKSHLSNTIMGTMEIKEQKKVYSDLVKQMLNSPNEIDDVINFMRDSLSGEKRDKVRSNAEILIESMRGIDFNHTNNSKLNEKFDKLYNEVVRGNTSSKMELLDNLIEQVPPKEFAKLLFSNRETMPNKKTLSGMDKDSLNKIKSLSVKLKKNIEGAEDVDTVGELIKNLSKDQIRYVVEVANSYETASSDFNKKNSLAKILNNFVAKIKNLFEKKIDNPVVKNAIKEVLEKGMRKGNSHLVKVDKKTKSNSLMI